MKWRIQKSLTKLLKVYKMRELESREIYWHLMIGKLARKITNTEWLCPFCNSWSNAVEWFISVNPNFKQCPKCKEIYL